MPVLPEETEFEIEFPVEAVTPAPAECRFHARCFAAWELERRR
jgi:hypothetical protein